MRYLANVVSVFIAIACFSVACASNSQDPPLKKVPVVAVYPWSFSENEAGTSEPGVQTAQSLLTKLFEERAGMVVLPQQDCVKGWLATADSPWETMVDDPAKQAAIPDNVTLLRYGRALNADYVCAGRLTWRVRSVWVALGPKTRVNASVDVRIIDVKKQEVALDVKGFDSGTGKAEKWYESAGALLVTWGVTVVSGGPKTPHMQASAIKAIGGATDPFISTVAQGSRKIQIDGK